MKKEMMRIMSVATGLFIKGGLKATTIDTICGECQVTKREFYTYFESKEVLICHIIAQWVGKSGRHLRMVPSFSFNAIIELQHFFSFVEETLATITPAVLSDLQAFYTEQWLRLSYFRDSEVYPFLIRNIERGLSEDIYRTTCNKLLLARLYALQVQVVRHEQKLIHEMHHVFIQGIVNAKGMKQLS